MNIQRYLTLHNEIMNRLEAGEITTETAKEINDLAFDKYITEGKIGNAVRRYLSKGTFNNLKRELRNPNDPKVKEATRAITEELNALLKNPEYEGSFLFNDDAGDKFLKIIKKYPAFYNDLSYTGKGFVKSFEDD